MYKFPLKVSAYIPYRIPTVPSNAILIPKYGFRISCMFLTVEPRTDLELEPYNVTSYLISYVALRMLVRFVMGNLSSGVRRETITH